MPAPQKYGASPLFFHTSSLDPSARLRPRPTNEGGDVKTVDWHRISGATDGETATILEAHASIAVDVLLGFA
jgi:hypothetical protein